MAKDDYLKHLAAVPLFARCSRAQLTEIARVADEIPLPAGTVLATEGELGRELFIILEGVATVRKGGVVVADVGPGGVVGEMAVIAQTVRNATVTAETDLVVLVLTPIGLSQLLDDVPGLAKHLLYEVTARLSSAVPDPAV
jgi:CRP/FNR family cyclic AMP-dependent transcriptional regulator